MLASELPFQFCAAGVGHCAACAGRGGVPPEPWLWPGPPFAPSVAFGVDQLVMPSASASALRVKSLFLAGLQVAVPGCRLIGVGQDEDAQPLVRRADLCRAEQTRRRRVAQSPKLSQDGLEPEGDVAGDVFEEDPFGGAFGDDAGDLGPEVAGVARAAALASGAEGLAGIPGEDGVEGPAEGPGIEAAQIIPDRGGGEIARGLSGDEDGAGPVLPFDEAPGVVSGLGQHEAQIKASAACAEAESVPGT